MTVEQIQIINAKQTKLYVKYNEQQAVWINLNQRLYK